MKKVDLPYNHVQIIAIIKKGGYIEMSSTNNRVMDHEGNHYATINDDARRAIVDWYGLKMKTEPTVRWVWPF